MDAGGVDNHATATGIPPTGTPPVDEDQHRQPLRPLTKIDLDKTGSLAEGAEGTLAPGESVTASATYVLTQADVDAGGVENTATTTGVPPTGTPPVDEDSVTVPVTPGPAIDLEKTGELPRGAESGEGDDIVYTFTVTNTGTVSLSEVGIDDELQGLSEISYDWQGEAGVLAPGDSVTATATYALTEADVQAGHVDNSASVTGTRPRANRSTTATATARTCPRRRTTVTAAATAVTATAAA